MKVKCYVYATWSLYSKEFNFFCVGYESSDKDYILIDQREIEVEPPSDAVLRQMLAAQLRGKKVEIQADATKRCTEMDQQIQELLALPAPASEVTL